MGGGEMAREMTSSMRKVTSYDQGHLNWLVHTDALRHLSVGLIPPTVGPVINAGRYPQVPLDPEGDVVDENGEVVAVVHQWFRGELEDNVLQRWGLQRPWMETRQRQEMNAQNSDTPTLSVATSNDSTRSSNPSDVHMTIPSHDTSAPVVFAVGLGASHPSALQRVHSKLWGLHQLNAPGVVSALRCRALHPRSRRSSIRAASWEPPRRRHPYHRRHLATPRSRGGRCTLTIFHVCHTTQHNRVCSVEGDSPSIST
mmetsp:Transcript_63089/g.149498  ORF Transcript_63089/g.149498 Transcript_63089/m.149498 type:complete len:256 (+) Transcript_63089:503-1270(+)